MLAVLVKRAVRHFGAKICSFLVIGRHFADSRLGMQEQTGRSQRDSTHCLDGSNPDSPGNTPSPGSLL